MRMRHVSFVLILSAAAVFGEGPDPFVAVHLEPTHVSYFTSLADMVALADSFRVPLTLQFTPQWADTIMARP
jgi:hypothetical protein